MTNHPLYIAILGGSGKAGRPLVEETLKAGYRVRVLLRHPETFGLVHPSLEIVQGDVRDATAVQELLRNSQALISTLGHTKGESTPMMAQATQSYLSAMEQLSIRRCIIVSSLFDTGYEKLDENTRQAADYMQRHYPAFMEARRREFGLLSDSSREWTYVRVPFIVQQPSVGTVSENLNYLPGPQITAIDLAHFLIRQLTDQTYIRKAPFVANVP